MSTPKELEFQGKLRIDRRRGVIYFDDDITGRSVLRVSGIPIEATVSITQENGLLDITDARHPLLQEVRS